MGWVDIGGAITLLDDQFAMKKRLSQRSAAWWRNDHILKLTTEGNNEDRSKDRLVLDKLVVTAYLEQAEDRLHRLLVEFKGHLVTSSLS
jgi:hypothetical protein